MKKLKRYIPRDNQLSTSSSTDNSTPSESSSTDKSVPSTSTSTDNSTPSTPSFNARSSDTYVYGVGIVTFLAIDVCVFFAYKTKNQTKIKSAMNSSSLLSQNNVICFKI